MRDSVPSVASVTGLRRLAGGSGGAYLPRAWRLLSGALGILAFALAFGHTPVATADPHDRPSAGVLAGKRIFVAPGHGWYYNASPLAAWTTQRGLTNGVIEDIGNGQICLDEVIPMLTDAGAEVVVARERSYQTEEVIVDNDTDAAPAYVESGGWLTGGVPGYRTSVGDGWLAGTGTYRWANAQPTESAVATFAPALAVAGRYPVYAAWVASANRVTDALFRVVHAGGTTEVRVDQTDQGSRWVFLGTFYFEAGTAGRVELSNQSAQVGVVIADAVRFGGGMGSIVDGGTTSGKPRWEESGIYWAQTIGASSQVNGTVMTMPQVAVWWGGVDLYLMWHSNAATGTARGTVSYFYNQAGGASAFDAQNQQLAGLIQTGVMNEITTFHDPTWNDRGVNSANFGELRGVRNECPAALLELAFHDNPTDAGFLKDPRFRHDAARGVLKAIVRYFAGAGATVPPLAPEAIRVFNTTSGLRVAWDWQTDAADPTAAAPTAARVYLSSDGRAFDDGRDVTPGASFYDIPGVAAGDTVFVRVTQTNSGGESRPSEVLAARRVPAGRAPQALIVSGFDRRDAVVSTSTGDNAAHLRQNARNYVIQHGAALSANGGYYFDSASNEAVISGRAPLAGYALVDWMLGEESTNGETFDSTERALVTTYLAGGGTLLATGAEIAWHLDFKGGDPAWFQTTFGASYAADDAGEYTGQGRAGGAFDGLSFSFDDGTQGAYDVDFPDVFTPSGAQAQAVLDYSTAGVAGVSNADPTHRTMLFGFPLETVTSATVRTALLGGVLAALGVTEITGGTGGTAGGGGGGSSGCGALSGAAGRGSLLPLALMLVAMLALLAGLRRRSAAAGSGSV